MIRCATAAFLAAIWLALAPLAPAQSADSPDGPPPYTPPLPAPSNPNPNPAPYPGLTASDVERIVDAAVQRALGRYNGQPASPSPQAAPALPSAQAALQGPQAGPLVTLSATAAVATPQPVSVLVPPGPVRRGLGQLGATLQDLSQPRVKTLRVAPIYAVPVAGPFATAPAASAVALPPLPSIQR